MMAGQIHKQKALTKREIQLLRFALQTAIASEEDYIDCHMEWVSVDERGVMKGYKHVVNHSNALITRMKKLRAKLA